MRVCHWLLNQYNPVPRAQLDYWKGSYWESAPVAWGQIYAGLGLSLAAWSVTSKMHVWERRVLQLWIGKIVFDLVKTAGSFNFIYIHLLSSALSCGVIYMTSAWQRCHLFGRISMEIIELTLGHGLSFGARQLHAFWVRICGIKPTSHTSLDVPE